MNRPGSTGLAVHNDPMEAATRLRAADRAYRDGDPEGIHDLRTSARRLREERPDLIDELRWLGRELGPARDAQVLRERLAARLAAEAEDPDAGPLDPAPARRLLGARLEADLAVGLRRADRALRGRRYAALLAALEHDPPEDAGPAPARAYRARVRKRIAAAAQAPPAERDDARHRVRKAARRARYAAEATGRHKLARRAERVQDHLGEARDAAAARRLLAELVRDHPRSSAAAAVLGRLDAAEQRAGRRATRRADAAMARLAD
ncbi:CHAD domain-containing protein [Naumannella cuiyingiana]|uniref:CHAD domain-containing protein n=1 Tax=Naumannella cuiyingiana TaxID=1347891 RepID=A0A7Z0IK01_9ACTN|nr:CHAD domain-containing protein [Naumannella cuiyingiana]